MHTAEVVDVGVQNERLWIAVDTAAIAVTLLQWDVGRVTLIARVHVKALHGGVECRLLHWIWQLSRDDHVKHRQRGFTADLDGDMRISACVRPRFWKSVTLISYCRQPKFRRMKAFRA